MQHGNAEPLVAIGMEALQQRVTIHAPVARAVNPAIQLRKDYRFHISLKNMHILRPLLLQPGAAGAAVVMVAGRNKHRNTAFFQGGLTYESGKIGILAAADSVSGAED